jgi:molybdopterin molybdotransferase
MGAACDGCPFCIGGGLSERVLGYGAAAEVVESEAERVRWEEKKAWEQVALAAADGRVLAEEVKADRDFPPFNRSTRDGFAVRAEDATEMKTGGRKLRVLGEVRAGEAWKGGPLREGECVEVMTGAPVPAGADAVVMVEWVERSGDAVLVQAGRVVKAGANIVAAGGEAGRGAVVVAPGTRMGPGALGIAAACGYGELRVWARPRIAIIATGDELVEVGETPGPSQIRNSNGWTLAAQVARAGGEAVVLRAAKDTEESLAERLDEARGCRLVLLAGGVSAGKYDLVEKVLVEQKKAELLFTGVRMQPGRPLVFGRMRSEDENSEEVETHFFGLPGNPVSAMVTFALFGRRMVAALAGEEGWAPEFAGAKLEEDVVVATGLTRFLPARVTEDIAGPRVRRVPWQGSGDMAAVARSNGFLVVPEDVEAMRAGEWATVLRGV